ncbi:MAG: AAA domain-containing protein [bacterium]
MNFRDIPSDILSIRVKSTEISADPLIEQLVYDVSPCIECPDEFELRLDDAIVKVTPSEDADIRFLNSELVTGRAMLARLVNPAKDGSIELEIAFFTGECLEMADVQIGVDEAMEHSIAKIVGRTLEGTSLYNMLEKRCCYIHGHQHYFFIIAGPAIDEALEQEIEKSANTKMDSGDEIQSKNAKESTDGSIDDSVDFQENLSQADQEPSFSKNEPTRFNSFCVIGDRICVVATENQLPDGNSFYIATRLPRPGNQSDRAIRLAKGRLSFVDWTEAGKIQILTKAQISALTQDAGSYLKKWDEFGNHEGDLLLKRAREIDVLYFTDMETERDGTVTVRIDPANDSALRALTTNDVEAVEYVDEKPNYLRNPHMTFAEFIEDIEKGTGERASYYNILNYDDNSNTLKLKAETIKLQVETIKSPDKSIPKSDGMLILSLAGEIAQIKRRMQARKKILEGRSANPQIGLLIEEKGEIAQTRRPHKVKPLTAFVRNKIFRNPPTIKQEEAIDIALNTPDIALIQGPPGTGKTTVIAAILERLNEIADKRKKDIKGMVLLTGFQHDAVENMIDRLSINGIPVPKFGKRSGEEEDHFTRFEKNMEEWCNNIASELRTKGYRIEEIEKETEFKNLCIQYQEAPTRVLALNLLKKISSLGITILGDKLSRQVANLERKFSKELTLNAESSSVIKAVRQLRHTPDAFLDDGPEQATKALVYLDTNLEEDEHDLLDKASLWNVEDGIPPFLTELAGLKKKLLIRFSAPPVFRVEKQNDEIVMLTEEVLKRIREEGITVKDKKSFALAEFLAELENNPYGMIDAVSDYSFAFAATCQQSVNREMQRLKGIIGNAPSGMEYEYVIVDEASRVSPRDLMIPMAMGKRIILVGDHRQLPHLIDETVAREMEEEKTGEDESEWIKKTMFQYLFSERLKVLEQKDGIRRHITLDRQYRMHPVLGEFISKNFYERFDPSERFGSGRPESDFEYNLPDTDGKPAIWIDVPFEKGRHERSGTSWQRRAEATAIAQWLNEWMNCNEGKNLSFGVISFYKAQSDLIRNQFKKQFGLITEDEKRLRVGTVDSFQGMEFDVVFLSIVRTMPRGWKAPNVDRVIQARKLFGHLCLYNRLNVSMSRQKKLLVVVGDPSLVQGDLAEEFIPGLVNFYDLCQTKGKVLPCR